MFGEVGSRRAGVEEEQHWFKPHELRAIEAKDHLNLTMFSRLTAPYLPTACKQRLIAPLRSGKKTQFSLTAPPSARIHTGKPVRYRASRPAGRPQRRRRARRTRSRTPLLSTRWRQPMKTSWPLRMCYLLFSLPFERLRWYCACGCSL